VQRLARCHALDTAGRYEEAIVCYTEAMQGSNPNHNPNPIAILIILGIIYLITR